MNIRPCYTRDVLSSPCCEEAQLTASELARRNEELAEAEDEIAGQRRLRDSEVEYWSGRAEKAEAERDEAAEKRREDNKKWLADYKELVVVLDGVRAERDELQAKLDAAEAELKAKLDAAGYIRGKLERELLDVIEVSSAQYDELQAKLDAAEGWPEWMGPAPTREELGEIEVTKSSRGYWAQGVRVAEPETKPEDLRQSNIVNDSISSCIRREAVARFIESEQAATDDEDQRIEEQAKALFRTFHPLSNWEENVHTHGQFRAAIRAGWTPPESEA